MNKKKNVPSGKKLPYDPIKIFIGIIIIIIIGTGITFIILRLNSNSDYPSPSPSPGPKPSPKPSPKPPPPPPPGPGCKEDGDCPGSYCINGPGHNPPYSCHGGPPSPPSPPPPPPSPPSPPPVSTCGVNDGDNSPECTTKAGKDSSSLHCSVCKYGWYNNNGSARCCSNEQHANQGTTGMSCIMTCLGQDIKGTHTVGCVNEYYGGLVFPTDACPKPNRSVKCDTRANEVDNCSFCDLGYRRPSLALDDWCCSEKDVAIGDCKTSCKNKCKYGSNSGKCPYYSKEDCPA